MVNKHFMNPGKCVNLRKKETTVQPNSLLSKFPPPSNSLIHFDGAALTAGLHQSSPIHSLPLSQQWPTPLGFIFTTLAQLYQFTSPPPATFYLVYSHRSSPQVIGTGLLKHGSYAIPLLKTIQCFSNLYSPQPRLLSVAFNISADNSSRASPVCTLNPGQAPQLWSQHTGVSCHCKCHNL